MCNTGTTTIMAYSKITARSAILEMWLLESGVTVVRGALYQGEGLSKDCAQAGVV